MNVRSLASALMVVAVWGIPAAADVPEMSSGPHTVALDGLDAFDCDGRVSVEFQQLPNGFSGLAAQDDGCYPFLAEMADNFVGQENYVLGLGWWGVYWNGSSTPPDHFRFTVFADDGGKPGAMLQSSTATDFNETVGDPNGYCAQFDDFFGAWEVPYHFSLTAVFCFPPQWGWATGDGDASQAHFRSEFFGYPDWVTAEEAFLASYDMAWIVYEAHDDPAFVNCCWPDGSCGSVPYYECDGGGVPVSDCEACGATPVDRTTFGRLKALYRN